MLFRRAVSIWRAVTDEIHLLARKSMGAAFVPDPHRAGDFYRQ